MRVGRSAALVAAAGLLVACTGGPSTSGGGPESSAEPLTAAPSSAPSSAPASEPSSEPSSATSSAPSRAATAGPRPSASRSSTPTLSPRGGWYVALGTSLAAGNQPDRGDDPRTGYAGLLHEQLRRDDPGLRFLPLACSGETLDTLVDGGQCSYDEGSQLDQAVADLEERRGEVALITLDMGANDLWPCARGAAAAQRACVREVLDELRPGLADVVERLRAAAPEARVVGLTYYDPLLAGWLVGGSLRQTARASAELLLEANAALAETYGAGGALVADVGAAFDTGDEAVVESDRGRLPADVDAVCRLTWMCAVGDVHPNDRGHRLIADTLAAVLTG